MFLRKSLILESLLLATKKMAINIAISVTDPVYLALGYSLFLLKCFLLLTLSILC